jgi:hypothetical protein
MGSMQPFVLPEFYMPYPARCNPHLEGARTHSKAWAYEMGILGADEDSAAAPIWDERAFDAHDYALLCAHTHPDAPAPFPIVFGTRDLASAKLQNDRLSDFMPLDCGPTPPPLNPLEKGLAELWQRTASPMAMDKRRQFRQGVEDMTESWLWEQINHMQHRIPDPMDYIEMRRKTFGSDLTMNLARRRRSSDQPGGRAGQAQPPRLPRGAGERWAAGARRRVDHGLRRRLHGPSAARDERHRGGRADPGAARGSTHAALHRHDREQFRGGSRSVSGRGHA